MSRNRTKEELEAELYEANEYIEELQAKLDDIIGIAGGDDEDAEEVSGVEDGGSFLHRSESGSEENGSRRR